MNLPQLGQSASPSRPWIGVHFLCANQYIRVFRAPDASHYNVRCPNCGRCTKFRIGEGGTQARQFEVSCR